MEDAGPPATAPVDRSIKAEPSASKAHARPFEVGQRVIYRGSDGVPQRVTIAQYSTNVPAGEEPMVAVRLPDGTVRDTVLSRLCRAGEEAAVLGGDSD
eukprot:SAG31_NODE_15333_length_760_cov_0.726172_1_plen_97_part_10